MEDDESMDDFFEEEEVFLENAVHCPICDDMTGHEILNEKPKGTGADYLLKCIDCSKVHTVHIRPPPVVEIPFILTEGPRSSTSRLEIDADEMIELEDVFQDDEKLWRINQIELHSGKKAKRAEASLIARASALRSSPPVRHGSGKTHHDSRRGIRSRCADCSRRHKVHRWPSH